ncbi:hypothetical protein X737_39845 [Mesorhizobium sp. L48C026A00]|nr:hypothetical protein X737_39845 [Mesorhizobium sp. L48C026A00]
MRVGPCPCFSRLEVAQRASQAIDAGDDERLARMDEVENGVELRAAFQGGAALLLLANDLAAGGLERGDLRRKVLVCR